MALPPGRPGGFDHGDVDHRTGRTFVAHTAFGTVDVIDPDSLESAVAIEDCPEGSGLICAPQERSVFAASRGRGQVVQFDADRCEVERRFQVGPKPNGLALANGRMLLVADVDATDQRARLIDLSTSTSTAAAETLLPGRPRWCVFDSATDTFLVNIREPASLLRLSARTGETEGHWQVSCPGPHGLDLDLERRRAFIACDGGKVVVLDLESGRELGAVAISGEPDAVWFNPRRQHLYVGIGNPGVVDVVDTGRLTVAETVVAEPGAKTSAFDVDRQRLYVFLPESSAAAVFEEG